MKNQKGISMIALIITIIVIIILAAIVFIASGDTMSSAQFSTFAQEFGDFQLNFQNDPLADVQLDYGTRGVALTKAQAIWLASSPENNTLPENVVIPAGSHFEELAGAVRNEAGDNLDLGSATVYCYEITDSQVEGYKADHKFYGDNLGTESHWVTSDGYVFTLPGYPRTVNSENRMYVSPEYYYVAGDNFANTVIGTNADTTAETKITPGANTPAAPEETPVS